jgi:Flp pilus assembly protein CpaB
MRSSTLIMIAVAAVFGLLAVFVSQAWLNRQAEARLKSLEAQKTVTVATRTLVVAARPLRFGTELTPSVLRELPWAGDALPQGAFTSLKELAADGKRIVLTAIETNEPILNTKITGSGQRATLSARVSRKRFGFDSRDDGRNIEGPRCLGEGHHVILQGLAVDGLDAESHLRLLIDNDELAVLRR